MRAGSLRLLFPHDPPEPAQAGRAGCSGAAGARASYVREDIRHAVDSHAVATARAAEFGPGTRLLKGVTRTFESLRQVGLVLEPTGTLAVFELARKGGATMARLAREHHPGRSAAVNLDADEGVNFISQRRTSDAVLFQDRRIEKRNETGADFMQL
jgi:hypothetical protein